MIIDDFRAEADLVGRRLRLSWLLKPEGTESLADAPRVQVRRKTRDFEFPTVLVADPWVIYDSAAFPPAPEPTVVITDLPGWETREGAEQTVWEAVSVAKPAAGGRLLEVLRRTTATVFAADGSALRRRIELLDNGESAFSLEPGTTYYYQLFSPALPAGADPWRYRATATPGEAFGLNRRLYDALPMVYKRHDVVARAPTSGSVTVPEANASGGQLRRFIDLFGAALDSLRGSAENLRTLHDVDAVDYRYLPLLADWLGWQLNFDDAIPVQRNEIKSANQIYRTVGTIAGIRGIVGRYAGWYVQVAEFAQQVMRANDAPQPMLWASKESAGTWVAPLDAARILGFDPTTAVAEGAGNLAATLSGTAAEPFPMLPGMELHLSVDGDVPAGVRFGATDFADPRNATAAEVAAAINAAMHELVATVISGGRLSLTTITVGPTASLRVFSAAADLVSLESGSSERPAAVVDALDRVRLFFPVARSVAGSAAERTTSKDATPLDIRVKTFASGRWLDAARTPAEGAADPAATLLTDGRLLLAWIANLGTARARPQFAVGQAQDETPAIITGSVREPFHLTVGSRLRLMGSFPAETLVLQAPDFTDPVHATAAEVASAVNARLTHVRGVAIDGHLRLLTVALGPQASLAVDLQGSTTARALGLANAGRAAHGGWDSTITWTPISALTSVLPGRHADAAALTDSHGQVRLFWSQHRQGLWRILTATWSDRVAAATPAGLAIFRNGAWTTLTTAGGLPSNDVRGMAADADGNLWVATAAGAALLRANGTTLVRDSGSGLASNDVRSIALAPDGRIFIGTGAGINILPSPTGAPQLIDAVGGLAGNDVRAVIVAGDGTAFIATASGASIVSAAGVLTKLQAPADLPSDDVRSVGLDDDGAAWFATAAGLARRATDGTTRVVGTADGLHSLDVRAVTPSFDGSLWVATAAGVSHRTAGGVWSSLTSASGLPGNDVRSVVVTPDGSLWVATTAGIGVRHANGVWTTWRQANGLPSDTVNALLGPISSARELAADGAGNREPTACLDDSGRIWLIWSQLQPGDAAEDRWTLRRRRYDPAAGVWDAEAAVTLQPGGSRAADRQPAAMAVPGSGPRVFFRSDRGNGNHSIWWLSLDPAGVASALASLPEEAAARSAPAVVQVAGEPWLLHRSDANVSVGDLLVFGASPQAAAASGQRLAGAGSLRRVAGSTTPVLAHRLRNSGRRSWGDLLSYTPQKPGGAREAPLQPDELMTRGTLGLYVSAGRQGTPLTQRMADRLDQLLARFLPINLRAVVILAPSIDQEVVYAPGADIAESYFDRYPIAEVLGPISDTAAAALPQWAVLTSNTAGSTSADPANLVSLRNRTFWPPVQ